jgi:uncharacterized membrane protein YphA (DoxX/SURF4 family)
MKPRAVDGILLAVRFGLGGIFFYAGIAKLRDSSVFATEIARLQLGPFSSAEWVAVTVPIVELLTGVWLVSGWRLRASALATMILGAGFAIAVGQAMARGVDFHCTCFGSAADSPSAGFVFARALGLFGIGALTRRMAQ